VRLQEWRKQDREARDRRGERGRVAASLTAAKSIKMPRNTDDFKPFGVKLSNPFVNK